MKTKAIGDIHGHNGWRSIVGEDKTDKEIFIGDYFDTADPNISSQQVIENFKDIMAYKRANPKRVVCLFGNHEFHYLATSKKEYSGLNKLRKTDIQELINGALKEGLLQMCHIQGNFLFVHAGVTKTWCSNNDIDMDNLENSINDLFRYKPNAFEFTVGKEYNKYGDETCQTPIWVRPNSLFKDRIAGYTQVVGHTQQDRLLIYDNVILIDTLGTSGEYLQIVDGVASACKINKAK